MVTRSTRVCGGSESGALLNRVCGALNDVMQLAGHAWPCAP